MKHKRFLRSMCGKEARCKRAWEDDDRESIIGTKKCQDYNSVQKPAIAENSGIDEECIHHYRVLPVKEEEMMMGDLDDMVDRNTCHAVHCNSDEGRQRFGQNNECDRQLPMWNEQTVVKDDHSCNSDSYGYMDKDIHNREDVCTKRPRPGVHLKREREPPRPKIEDNNRTQDEELSPVPPAFSVNNKLGQVLGSSLGSAQNNDSTEASIEGDYLGPPPGLPFPPTLDLSTLKEVDVPLNWESKSSAYRATIRKDYTGVIKLSPLLYFISSFSTYFSVVFVVLPNQVDSLVNFR